MAKYVSKENLQYIWTNKLKTSLAGKQDSLTQAQLNALNSGITSSLVNKLNGIESGAQVNVQSDWNATTGDAFIKNKPTIGNGTLHFSVEGNEIGTFKANQDSTGNINITLNSLGLNNTLVFKGVFQTLPSLSEYNKGAVVIVGNKEYVRTDSAWTELGDESAYAYKTITVTGTGALSGGGSLESNRTISHNTIGSAALLGLYKIKTDEYGHVSEHTAVTKTDITNLGIPKEDTNQKISVGTTTFGNNSTINIQASGDTTLNTDSSHIYINTKSYGMVSQASNGMMYSTDKVKLDGVANNATCVYIDSSILASSTNAAQSGAVSDRLNKKVNVSDSLTEAEINSICS